MSQQGGPEDSEDEMVKVGVALLVAALLIFWIIWKNEYRVNAILGAVTFVHIAPFALLTEYVPFVERIPFLGSWLFSLSADAMEFLGRGGYAAMTSEARNSLLIAGGRCAAVIYGGALLSIALRGNQFRVDEIYRNLHSLETMIRIQSTDWVTSRIARHVNPLDEEDVDARSLSGAIARKYKKGADVQTGSNMLAASHLSIKPGTWKRALRPEEWLVAHGLAFEPERHKVLTDPEGSFADRDFAFPELWPDLQISDVSEAFASQLRAPWRGPEHLSPSLRGIFAVMALFYDYDIDAGNALLEDMGLIADSIKVKPRSMDSAIQAEAALMAKIDKVALGRAGRMLAKSAKQHAWVETAMPTMLAVARKDRGVLPPAAFLWLKAEDRLMWYILSCVGNEAILVEAAGALAHARAEVQLDKPIYRPAMFQASRALLEDYLDMTPTRITARAIKAERRRTPGEQLALMRDELAKQAKQDKSDDGEGWQA